MGRIKTQVAQRLTADVMDRYGDNFTDDFNKNKELIRSLTGLSSKKLRNVVAGYIARIVKVKRKKEI